MESCSTLVWWRNEHARRGRSIRREGVEVHNVRLVEMVMHVDTTLVLPSPRLLLVLQSHVPLYGSRSH